MNSPISLPGRNTALHFFHKSVSHCISHSLLYCCPSWLRTSSKSFTETSTPRYYQGQIFPQNHPCSHSADRNTSKDILKLVFMSVRSVVIGVCVVHVCVHFCTGWRGGKMFPRLKCSIFVLQILRNLF